MTYPPQGAWVPPPPPKKKGLGTGAIVAIVLVSMVVLVVGPLTAIAIPTFLSQRAKEADSFAKADVSTLGKDITTYFVDHYEPPVVEQRGDAYVIDDFTVPVSDGVELGGFTATGPTDWCVWVHADGGNAKDYQYSSEGGLEQGTCGN